MLLVPVRVALCSARFFDVSPRARVRRRNCAPTSFRAARQARASAFTRVCVPHEFPRCAHTASFPTYPACRLTDKDLVLSPFGRITDFLELPQQRHIDAL